MKKIFLYVAVATAAYIVGKLAVNKLVMPALAAASKLPGAGPIVARVAAEIA